MKKETRIAIVPGSFDPITNGHIDIIRRAAQKYDKVFVAVMINASKQYLFTMAQRKRLAELAVCHLENAEVIASEGMLWELARDLGACAIVKGYRNEKDLAYESGCFCIGESPGYIIGKRICELGKTLCGAEFVFEKSAVKRSGIGVKIVKLVFRPVL